MPTATIPESLARRPRDSRGYPITWVTYIAPDGTPDFRVIDHARVAESMERKLCGLCGEPLTYYIAFIGGPMSVEHRLYSDPPMHVECAEYAMKTCPFLAIPNYQYASDESVDKKHEGKPVDLIVDPLMSNVKQKATAIYITRRFRIEVVDYKDRLGFRRRNMYARPATPVSITWYIGSEKVDGPAISD